MLACRTRHGRQLLARAAARKLSRELMLPWTSAPQVGRESARGRCQPAAAPPAFAQCRRVSTGRPALSAWSWLWGRGGDDDDKSVRGGGTDAAAVTGSPPTDEGRSGARDSGNDHGSGGGSGGALGTEQADQGDWDRDGSSHAQRSRGRGGRNVEGAHPPPTQGRTPATTTSTSTAAHAAESGGGGGGSPGDDELAAAFGSSAVRDTDLRHPHEFYPLARQLRRKVFLHIGPTNSGKTHNAVEALKAARTGVFCGPLRLLAWEMFEKLNALGVPCNLVTGQEKQEVLDDDGNPAEHIACTVEMLPTQGGEVYDVAVIDEIQMIGDDERGWAWTRAFLGCQAREVHLCGDVTTGPLIQQLCDIMGEPLEIRNYERLNPLVVQRTPVRSFAEVEPGDCLVGFSRRSLFQFKRQVEEAHSFETKACIVYGGLPPATRKDQARLFNSPDNEYNILVATDAIGMGLNLNIKRVIFSTMEKWDGFEQRLLKPREVQQIAGRAGRFGMDNEQGYVAVMHSKDVGHLKRLLGRKVPPLKRAGIAPSVEQLEVFSQRPDMQDAPFSAIMWGFMQEARCSDLFFLCDTEEPLRVAEMLDEVEGLSLSDCATFCMAPVATRSEMCLDALYHYASGLANATSGQRAADPYGFGFGGHVPANIYVPKEVPRSPQMIAKLEEIHKVADLYLWLSLRYPATFPDGEEVQEQLVLCAELIEKGLEQLSAAEKKKYYRALADQTHASSKKKRSRRMKRGFGRKSPRRRDGRQ